MNLLNIEYRDPLFGIIVLFTLIFIVSFVAYSFKQRKEQQAKEEHKKLLSKFQFGSLEVERYVDLYKKGMPLESILLLGATIAQKGDSNKAINLYLNILQLTKERLLKEEILENLGKTYYKTGLLQRSKDIFLKILKFSPRNNEALFFLLLSYEKLQEYAKALEVIEPLQELGIDVNNDKLYLLSEIIINDSMLTVEQKTKQLHKLSLKYPILERSFAIFLSRFDQTNFWKITNEFNCKNIIDIFWYIKQENINLKVVQKNIFLAELYSAKGYCNIATQSSVFAFDVLLLQRQRGDNTKRIDLCFEYICNHCKTVHHIFHHRCTVCNKALSMQVTEKIIEITHENNSSLQ